MADVRKVLHSSTKLLQLLVAECLLLCAERIGGSDFVLEKRGNQNLSGMTKLGALQRMNQTLGISWARKAMSLISITHPCTFRRRTSAKSSRPLLTDCKNKIINLAKNNETLTLSSSLKCDSLKAPNSDRSHSSKFLDGEQRSVLRNGLITCSMPTVLFLFMPSRRSSSSSQWMLPLPPSSSLSAPVWGWWNGSSGNKRRSRSTEIRLREYLVMRWA